MGVPPAPSDPENRNRNKRGWVVALFARVSNKRDGKVQVWASGVTPGTILRSMGPMGSSFLRNYTARRFAYLNGTEADNLHYYIYYISNQEGSGEHALSALLHPGVLDFL